MAASTAEVDINSLLSSIIKETIIEQIEILKHGKQQNDVKLRMIAQSLPFVKNMDIISNKILASRNAIVEKIAAALWKQGHIDDKFSTDSLRTYLSLILKGRGIDDSEMAK